MNRCDTNFSKGLFLIFVVISCAFILFVIWIKYDKFFNQSDANIKKDCVIRIGDDTEYVINLEGI